MATIPTLALFATCIAAIWSCNENAIATAASPAPVPSAADCTEVVYEMLPCVDYLTIGSTKASASRDCCKVAGDVLKWTPECMCEALKQSEKMGIQLNMTRALGLPTYCRISSRLPDCGIPLPPGVALPPVPSTKAPSKAPGAAAPRPFPSRKVPMPAPRTGPSSAPVNPPTPSRPTPGVMPRGVAPSGLPPPSNDDKDSPASAPSGAPSFTICSNLIAPLLLTLLASFQPL